jgi:glycosyltransferase involved in cell wall biosynthesis
MHILLIHQAFATLDEPGGTRHHELARHFQRQGHQVTVVTGQASYLTGEGAASGWLMRDRDDLGVRVLRSYSLRGIHRSFLRRLLAFFLFTLSSLLTGLRVREVDVVWGTSPPLFQGFSAWLVGLLKGKPFVFEVRDLWPDFAVAVGVIRNPLLIALSRWLEGFLYRRARWIVVNSPGFVDHVKARGARRVQVVPNGVDLALFPADLDGGAQRRRLGWGDRFVALYAGAHGLPNDLDVLLDAAKMLQEDQEVLVALVGDGKEKPRLQARAAAEGIANLTFLDPRPKAAMPSLLAACDAGVAILQPLPAFRTTYPNKVFDYMAAGKPVILAIDGVIRKVVEDAGCGIFVPPGDPGALAAAIRQLAADRRAASRMGQAGRRYVAQHFERRQQAEKMLALFRRVAEAGS